MNNPSIERLLADALQHAAPASAPETLVEETVAAARNVRRRPRWLALVAERPMGRAPAVLVGSPGMRTAWLAIALVLAALVATLALVAGGIVPSRDLALVTPSQTVGPTPGLVSAPPPVATASPSQVVPGRVGLVAYTLVRPRDPDASPCTRALRALCEVSDAWLANADGSGPHRLFPDDQTGGAVLGWSADGSRLLYEGGPTGLLVADPNGDNQQAIETHVVCEFAGKNDPFDRNVCTGADSFALSPDGSRIAFVRGYANAKGATVVAILDLASGTVTELAATRATNGSEQCWHSTSCEGMNELPRWSPDGRQLAFARQVISPEAPGMWTSAAVYVIGVDGTGLRRVTSPGMYAFDASWSPDGTTLAFTNTEMVVNKSRTTVTDMLTDVWTVRVDGSDLVRRTGDGHSYGPHWTRDGRRLTFTRDEAPWVMNADGAGETRLDGDLLTLSEAGCLVCLYPASSHAALWQPIP